MLYLINYHHELLLSFVMIVAALGDASNPHMLVDGFDSHGCTKTLVYTNTIVCAGAK